MPPQQASQSCRAVGRGIISPRPWDAIWISDSVLTQALDRFCLAYRPARRKASSVPGPLESRRRLGKRQIGDLNSLQSHASLPLWAQPVALDLSQWQWYPPTVPSGRSDGTGTTPSSKLAETLGLRSLGVSFRNRVSSVLRGSPEDIPIPLARNTLDRTARQRSPSFMSQCADLEANIAGLAPDQAVAACQDICRQYQQQLALGLLAKEDVDPARRAVMEAFDSRFASSSINMDLKLQLYKAIVDGLASCRVLNLASFDISLWSALLIDMSKLPASEDVWRLFNTVMREMPADYINCLPQALVSMLRTLLGTWVGTEAFAHGRSLNAVVASTQQSSVTMLASSLEKVDPKQHDALLQTCAEIILARTGTPEWQHSVRYSWLSVLAHMPLVNQDLLLETSSQLFNDPSSLELLSDTSLSHLLINQWASRGYLDHPDGVRHLFRRLLKEQPDAGLGALALAIFRRQTPDRTTPVFISLWKFLRSVGRTDQFLASLQAVGEQRNIPRRLLEVAAWASDDHAMALRLNDWYMEKMWKPGRPKWGCKFWEKFAERMIMDPSVSPGTLWRVLDIDVHANQKIRPEALGAWKKGKDTLAQRNADPNTAPLFERMAKHFSHAPHLGNRVALRHVSQCVRLLAASQPGEGQLPASVVKSLLRVIVRDLSEGGPGRTARLRYLLGLVERHQGTAAAHQCAEAIQRWRMFQRQLPKEDPNYEGKAGPL